LADCHEVEREPFPIGMPGELDEELLHATHLELADDVDHDNLGRIWHVGSHTSQNERIITVNPASRKETAPSDYF
jgi:hypothetical protein